MNRSQKLLLLLPALWASLFDIVVTIILQPSEYWAGNLDSANEGNPIGAFMMKNHESGIFVISIIWLLIIGLLGYYLPNRLSRIFLVFVLIAHTSTASTWISRYGFWFVIAFAVFNSILFCIVDEFVKAKSQISNLKS